MRSISPPPTGLVFDFGEFDDANFAFRPVVVSTFFGKSALAVSFDHWLATRRMSAFER